MVVEEDVVDVVGRIEVVGGSMEVVEEGVGVIVGDGVGKGVGVCAITGLGTFLGDVDRLRAITAVTINTNSTYFLIIRNYQLLLITTS